MKLMNLINEVPSGNMQAMASFFNANQTATCYVSKSLWHNKIGHPFDQVVDVLQSNLNFTKDFHIFPCDIYHKSKHTREHFPLSDHTSTAIGELVHVDLWVLIKLSSSVLNGKSPFELVYGLKPKLSHLRNFGCLCFSYVLNNSDKFSARSTQTSDGSKDNIATSMGENTSYKGTDLFQLGINNAFLYSDLSEDVYITLPHGFDNDKFKVCKLNKSLYGIKQALRQWNGKLTKALIDNGFVQSKFDYSLFTKKYDDVFIALLVYVDDIVITGDNLSEIEKFKLFLKSKFQIKDLGKLKYFLRIKVLVNKYGICLSQRKYCLELLHEYGL
nr:ribonuclease H-like domain-containing protein [Tanacetum cinerariifolium]